jgi:hypothetical protein
MLKASNQHLFDGIVQQQYSGRFRDQRRFFLWKPGGAFRYVSSTHLSRNAVLKQST